MGPIIVQINNTGCCLIIYDFLYYFYRIPHGSFGALVPHIFMFISVHFNNDLLWCYRIRLFCYSSYLPSFNSQFSFSLSLCLFVFVYVYVH